jgi:uroporphyrinogen decarboxylase
VNPKQNALEIIRFGHPERITSGPPCHTLAWYGCNHEGYDAPHGHDCPVGTVWTDVWGTVWQKEQEGIMGFPRLHPLAETGALRTYRWPDADDERICGRIYQQSAGAPRAGRFLLGSHRETLWEKAYMLVGMENMMAAFYTEPEYAREVLHRVMDFGLRIAEHYVRAGIEIAGLGDDLGTQTGPLLGPRIVREFLVPQYRRLFEFYRKRGVLISFHSCGNMVSLLDTFMDLGVDILNPVQATANDLDTLRARTQGRMCLHGGVSTATLEAGPVSRIVAEVRQRLWQLGRSGGYFCCQDQGLNLPKAHVEACYQAVKKYGAYPIAPPGA